MEQLNGETSIGAEGRKRAAGHAHGDAGSDRAAGNGWQLLVPNAGRGCSKGRAELDPLLLVLCPDHLLWPLAAAEQGRWHSNSPQILPPGFPPSRAHPQLLPPPSGQPRGDHSIRKPAPSTSSQHAQTPATPSPNTNLPFATAVAHSLPIRHSRATHRPHPGLHSRPRTQGQARGPGALLKAGCGARQRETRPSHKRAGGCWGSAGWLWESPHPAR